MNLRAKKRLIARMLGVGASRVRIDPEALEDVRDAITKDSLRGLLKSGAVWVERPASPSRGRARQRRGRRRGPGSRKGPASARLGRKRQWVLRVRGLRRLLKEAKRKGKLDRHTYWRLYYKIKGGEIRTQRQLKQLIAEAAR
ncbi:MAG: 50S ribosomal protein L19e [Nitrososphaerota archaeon]